MDHRINQPARVSNSPLPLPDKVALVLQGGGALGSYQAGVYEALHDRAVEIDWVAGISIGAINSAISHAWEGGARDFEFSRATMLDHWAQGHEAVEGVMCKGDLIAQNIVNGKSSAFDLDRPDHLKEKKA